MFYRKPEWIFTENGEAYSLYSMQAVYKDSEPEIESLPYCLVLNDGVIVNVDTQTALQVIDGLKFMEQQEQREHDHWEKVRAEDKKREQEEKKDDGERISS